MMRVFVYANTNFSNLIIAEFDGFQLDKVAVGWLVSIPPESLPDWSACA